MFRKKGSTEMASMHHKELILKALELKLYTLGIFVYLTEALEITTY